MALVSGGGSGGGGSLVPIYSKTLTGSQATFDTNTIFGGNLPTNHTSLQIELVGAETGAETNGPVIMQFNGDNTSGHYVWSVVQGSGSAGSVTTNGGSDVSLQIGQLPGSTVGISNSVGNISLIVANYTATTLNKSYTGSWSMQRNTTAANQFAATVGGLWLSTAAITRIVLTPNLGSFATGTWFAIYGLN